jgi:phosphoribosylformylglycinamidine (FGAM) synthase-like amidotransferase family enzyme
VKWRIEVEEEEKRVKIGDRIFYFWFFSGLRNRRNWSLNGSAEDVACVVSVQDAVCCHSSW